MKKRKEQSAHSRRKDQRINEERNSVPPSPSTAVVPIGQSDRSDEPERFVHQPDRIVDRDGRIVFDEQLERGRRIHEQFVGTGYRYTLDELIAARDELDEFVTARDKLVRDFVKLRR